MRLQARLGWRSAFGSSDVPTPAFLVVMLERSRVPRRQQGGFQRHTTPAKKAQRELFEPLGDSEDDSELSTADEESNRSSTSPPRDRPGGREDLGLQAELRRLSAMVTKLQDSAAAHGSFSAKSLRESTLTGAPFSAHIATPPDGDIYAIYLF